MRALWSPHPVQTAVPLPVSGAAPAPAAIITVRDLTVNYAQGKALDDVSLTVHTGERLAIIGPNGAGKSTLLKAIMGLLNIASGEITVEGSRQRLGYVAQNDDVDWRFPITVRDAVMMGRARFAGSAMPASAIGMRSGRRSSASICPASASGRSVS